MLHDNFETSFTKSSIFIKAIFHVEPFKYNVGLIREKKLNKLSNANFLLCECNNDTVYVVRSQICYKL